jgi:hypothetical protein
MWVSDGALVSMTLVYYLKPIYPAVALMRPAPVARKPARKKRYEIERDPSGQKIAVILAPEPEPIPIILEEMQPSFLADVRQLLMLSDLLKSVAPVVRAQLSAAREAADLKTFDELDQLMKLERGNYEH